MGSLDCSALALLLVDDEATFRISLAEMLRDDGHEVRDYGAPAELPSFGALANVAVLLTDYEMPGRNGLDLADEFHAHHPAVPVIVLTAYRLGALETQAKDRPFLQLASKPVDYPALHALIHRTASAGVRT